MSTYMRIQSSMPPFGFVGQSPKIKLSCAGPPPTPPPRPLFCLVHFLFRTPELFFSACDFFFPRKQRGGPPNIDGMVSNINISYVYTPGILSQTLVGYGTVRIKCRLSYVASAEVNQFLGPNVNKQHFKSVFFF